MHRHSQRWRTAGRSPVLLALLALVGGLTLLAVGCSSSKPTASTSSTATASTAPAVTSTTPAADQTAITTAWTTFFNGSTTVREKAAVLENGTASTNDIALFFGLYPHNLTTRVESVQLNGTTASVIYEFFAGSAALSPRPMTGTAVDIDGKWLVSQSTWATWVAQSDIHGSG